MKNWYIGQDIVTIKPNNGMNVGVDELHTIRAIENYRCKCHPQGRILISTYKPLICTVGVCRCMGDGVMKDDGYVWLQESYFKPLDELVNTEELNNIKEQIETL